MSSRFHEKIVLITGSGRGIGAACAAHFAAEGARVVLSSQTLSELESTRQKILAETPDAKLLILPCDVSDEALVKKLFDTVLKTWGAVEILVNNAAIAKVEDFTELSLESWERTMAVNLRGPFLCAREAFLQMRSANKGGAIVNLSSLAGIRGTEKFKGFTAYTVSKHGIVGLTESLAVEGKPYNIRVNCVAPGAVKTQMLEEVAPFFETKTTPDQIAKTILFLCDEKESGVVSGAIVEIHCNG